MNILFTCAGRRNYLINYFKTIQDLRVIACDASSYAPALYIADEYFIVPDVYDTNYISILLSHAKARKISAIIPLNDLELPVLAANRHKFEEAGIKVIVSDGNVVDICFDKLRTIAFTEDIPVSTIPTFLDTDHALSYKKMHPECSFVLKPRWGSASLGIEYPQDDSELIIIFNLLRNRLIKSFHENIKKFDPHNCILIQKKISGQEYGMDVINNLNAENEGVLIRKKIAMRAGETDRAETVDDKRLKDIGIEIGRRLKHIGPLDCDLFVENDEIYLLEMNPRFGGGYPFMHFAGANLPLALVEWLRGNNTPVGAFNYRVGSVSAKVDIITGLQ